VSWVRNYSLPKNLPELSLIILTLVNGQSDTSHFFDFRDHDGMSSSPLNNNAARPPVFADEWHQFLPLIRSVFSKR
jgi:hypothetical protein